MKNEKNEKINTRKKHNFPKLRHDFFCKKNESESSTSNSKVYKSIKSKFFFSTFWSVFFVFCAAKKKKLKIKPTTMHFSSHPLGGAAFPLSSGGWCCLAFSFFGWWCFHPCALWAVVICPGTSITQKSVRKEARPKGRGGQAAPPERRQRKALTSADPTNLNFFVFFFFKKKNGTTQQGRGGKSTPPKGGEKAPPPQGGEGREHHQKGEGNSSLSSSFWWCCLPPPPVGGAYFLCLLWMARPFPVLD